MKKLMFIRRYTTGLVVEQEVILQNGEYYRTDGGGRLHTIGDYEIKEID